MTIELQGRPEAAVKRRIVAWATMHEADRFWVPPTLRRANQGDITYGELKVGSLDAEDFGLKIEADRRHVAIVLQFDQQYVADGVAGCRHRLDDAAEIRQMLQEKAERSQAAEGAAPGQLQAEAVYTGQTRGFLKQIDRRASSQTKFRVAEILGSDPIGSE